MDKHITEVSFNKRVARILEAWEGYRLKEGLPDDVPLFVKFLIGHGFYVGVQAIGDDELAVWDKMNEYRGFSTNHGEVRNGI